MNLLENLKQFKNIQPAADFSVSSRARIIGGRMRLGDILRQNSPMAFATVALALLFVFAGTHFLTGSKVTAIDPRGLRAEAQAIDIQIQLTNLDYSATEGSQTTPATAQNIDSSKKAPASGGDTLDDALKALSE
jgi:hypothetical protein